MNMPVFIVASPADDTLVAAGGRCLVAPSELQHAVEAGYYVHGAQPLFLSPVVDSALASFCDTVGWRLVHPSRVWGGRRDVLTLSDGRTIHVCGPETAEELEPYLPRPMHVVARAAMPAVFTTTAGTDALAIKDGVLTAPELAALTAFVGAEPLLLPPEELSFAARSLQVHETVLAPRHCPQRLIAWWCSLGLDVVEREKVPAANRLHGIALPDSFF